MAATLHLDRNEYFFTHPHEVLEAAAAEAADCSRYATHASQHFLAQKIATLLEIDAAQIALGHGAEDLLLKTLLLFAVRKKIFLADFSWNNYNVMAGGLGYEIFRTPVTLNKNGCTTDLRALDSMLSLSPPAVVLLATPNNPTGHTLNKTDLNLLIAAHPQHIFLLDSVYDTPRCTGLELALTHTNCIHFGSFSKFFGMPGMRVGYAVGTLLPPAFRLSLGLQPTAVAMCLAALSCVEYYESNRNQMLENAKALKNFDGSFVEVFSTSAPFVLMKLLSPMAPEIFAEATATSGVVPKIFQHDGTWLRWGLGPKHIVDAISNHMSVLKNMTLPEPSAPQKTP